MLSAIQFSLSSHDLYVDYRQIINSIRWTLEPSPVQLAFLFWCLLTLGLEICFGTNCKETAVILLTNKQKAAKL